MAQSNLTVQPYYDSIIKEYFYCPNNINQIGELPINNWHRIAKAIISPHGACTCIHTQSNNLLQKVLVITDD